MSDQQVRVTFQPHGRTVYVLPGTNVLEGAARAGMIVETPCGGSGTCGKCRIQITKNPPAPAEPDRNVFSKAELQDGWRLACQTVISHPTVIHIPDSSLLTGRHQILTEGKTEIAAEILPGVRKIYIELPTPTLEDEAADILRLERRIGPLEIDLELLRGLSRVLRDNDFKGTAVLAGEHLIDFEPGDTTARCHGAAFDIGTTTVVGSLLDLRSGEEVALRARMNPQVSYGEDVLSRVKYAGESSGNLRELKSVIIKAITEMIDEMCTEAGVPRERIYELTFAGNTTMQHLLCGINVTQLGEVPFVPAQARSLILSAQELGVPIHRRGTAYVFPVIGGFVGGDTVAGMLATRSGSDRGPVMMVDIGTNGEIVLYHEGKIRAASTAAGPAFEGARISCGMRATTGAIEKIVFDGDLRYSVIGDVSPLGVCGSALVDLGAELLREGILSPEGRLLPPEELPAKLAPPLRKRLFIDSDNQTQFLISDGAGGARERRLTLTQRDVRELQLAVGAIRAGISILLRKASLGSTDLKRVLIAGGFGSFIRRSNAQRIGLLPADIEHSRIQYVGNASLAGARWALLSTNARRQAEQLARETEHVELSQDANFQKVFAEAMIFPSGR